eukprot:291748-Pyramimonas_sp.AAC.1
MTRSFALPLLGRRTKCGARRSPPGLPPLTSNQLHHGVATFRDAGFPSSVPASSNPPGILR